MTEEEWKAHVVELTRVAVIHPQNPPDYAQSLLVRTYFLIQDAPRQLMIELGATPESELIRVAETELRAFESDNFNLLGIADTDCRTIIKRLFARLRALDALVSRQTASRKTPTHPERQWFVDGSPYAGYLIPRVHGRKEPARKDPPKRKPKRRSTDASRIVRSSTTASCRSQSTA